MRDWQPILGLPLWFWLFIAPSLFALFCLYNRNIARRIITPVWRILDPIYKISGVIAASFMAIILCLIVGQMVSRWTGTVFPGGTEFAGYAMACTPFFALAYTLNHGAHIRVSIFLNMNDFLRYWLDAFAMLISAITATYFARYAVKTNFFSEMLNDRTQGLDQVQKKTTSELLKILEEAQNALTGTPSPKALEEEIKKLIEELLFNTKTLSDGNGDFNDRLWETLEAVYNKQQTGNQREANESDKDVFNGGEEPLFKVIEYPRSALPLPILKQNKK